MKQVQHTRAEIHDHIVYHSGRLAAAKWANKYHDQSEELIELRKWLARYVLSVVRESDSIEANALRSLLSDDIPEGDTEVPETPSDARVPDPGTVACPNCDEPVRGYVLYSEPPPFQGQKPVTMSYVCDKCGWQEHRDL